MEVGFENLFYESDSSALSKDSSKLRRSVRSTTRTPENVPIRRSRRLSVGPIRSDSPTASDASTSSFKRSQSLRVKANGSKVEATKRRSNRSTIAKTTNAIKDSLEKSTIVEKKSVKPSVKSESCELETTNNNAFEFDKILGASEIKGKLHFLIQWKDHNEPSMMSSDEAKIKYTYNVLDFLESYITWETDDEDDNDDDEN